MNKDLSEIVEALAGIEHDRWAHWQRYLHEQGIRTDEGGLLLPAELVARWERQFQTPYADLTEAEKQSDRDQVWRYLPLLIKAVV